MRTQSADTDFKTEKVLISLLRGMKASKKFAQVRSLSETTMKLSRRAIFSKNPELNDLQKKILLVHYFYGQKLAAKFSEFIEKRVDGES